MLAMPDPDTAFIDPFMAEPTLSSPAPSPKPAPGKPTPATRAASPSAPRNTCISTGVADAAVFGPEAEFFIFDNVQFDAKPNGTFYSVDSDEGIWNTGRVRAPNLGYKIRHKEGYFPVPPTDTSAGHPHRDGAW